MDDDSIPLTMYLVKPDKVKDFAKTFLTAAQTKIKLPHPLKGVFVPLPASPKPPEWVPAVENLLGRSIGPGMTSMSPSGLMVFNSKSGTFVLTFGHAAQKLKASWLVEEFGRSVVLNAIPRGGLVETNADQVLGRRHRSIERAPKGAPVEDFHFEPDRDLVNKVGGFPLANSILGKKIAGGKNLRVHCSLSQLDEILTEADSLSRSLSHRTKWPEFSHFRHVHEEKLVAKLDQRLADALNGKAAESTVVMTEPDPIDEMSGPASFYVIGTKRKPLDQKPFLCTSFLKSYFSEKKISISPESLRGCKINIKYERPSNEQPEEWAETSAFSCLAFQTSANQKTYALSGGIWFELSGNLVRTTEETIVKIAAGPGLVPWNGKDREETYNEDCAAKHGFLNFDKKNLPIGGGSSRIEVCDFVDVQGNVLYYVKRIGSKSQSMSHFVEQVRRSLEVLFGADQEHRTLLAAKTRKVYPDANLSWLDTRLEQGHWTLCLVSIGRSKESLPFFAKRSLAKLSKELWQQGHRLAFTAT